MAQHFEMATLVQANCDERDLQLFLESEVGIFLIETGKLELAHQVLASLKGEIV